MRMTYVSDELERVAFAEDVARCFQANPQIRTYTRSGDLAPGELLGIRWGMGDDCVVVVRIGDDQPVNFGGIVRTVQAEVKP